MNFSEISCRNRNFLASSNDFWKIKEILKLYDEASVSKSFQLKRMIEEISDTNIKEILELVKKHTAINMSLSKN